MVRHPTVDLLRTASVFRALASLLDGVRQEASRFSTFEEFRRAFLWDIRHGTYWHVTRDPDFQIEPEKGPRDMSSMSGGNSAPGALMVTSDLPLWADHYSADRPYAALIDTSGLTAPLKQVNRGFGNEFFIPDASEARVYPIKEALRRDRDIHRALPQNEGELKALYESVQEEVAQE